MFENVFSGVAVLLGAAFIVAGLRVYFLGRQARSWLPAPGVVLTSRVVPAAEGQHQPLISYRYTFSGTVFESNRVRFIQHSSSLRGPAEAVVARFRPTQQIIAFVNPTHPSEALLERDPQLSSVLLFMVAGAGALAFGLFRLLSAIGWWPPFGSAP
jgi:hypothetical protein